MRFKMSEKLYSFLYKIALISLIYNTVSFFSPFIRTVSLDTLVFKNNDGRIVVLQAMSHVAPEDFYTHVNSNIKSFLNTHDDGKIFLEGIHNGNEDDLNNNKEFVQKLKEVVGEVIPVDDETGFDGYYKSLADTLGWAMESDNNYLKDIPKDSLVKADITAQELIKLYDNKINDSKEPKEKPLAQDKLNDITKDKNIVSSLFNKLIVKRSVLQGIINAQHNNSTLDNNETINDIVLDARNSHLINMIEKSSSDVFVTYGAAHLYCGNVPLIDTLKNRGYTLISTDKYKL